MTTAEIIGIILLSGIFILLFWNIYELYYLKTHKEVKSEYFELKAKMNFIAAVGSLFIFVAAYLGFNVKEYIIKKSDPLINRMIEEKKLEIDTLLASKNILKAGIYIVSDLDFKEDSIYKFELLKTIDNKRLPAFSNVPKLIINTNTGEDLRIKEVNRTYFIIEKPQLQRGYLTFGNNPKYRPIKLKFDVWIADYKAE